ncbi:MAG: AsmA family protein [bacterium]
MKKTMKIISIVSAILLIALFGLSLLVKIYFTPDKIKSFVITQAEKAFGRKVLIESVDINIFKGIEVRNIHIQDNPAFRSDAFLSAEEFILKYSLFPLLKRQLNIHEIVMVKPQIIIERDEEGSFNFSDLIQKIQSGGPNAAQDPRSKALPFLLSISHVEIRNGTVTFYDRFLPSPASPIIIDNVYATAEDISVTEPFEIALRASLHGNQDSADLSLSGKVDQPFLNTELRLSADNLNVATFLPYYHDLIPMQSPSALLSLQIGIKSTEHKEMQAHGEVNLTEVSFSLPSLPPGERVKDQSVKVSFQTGVDFTQQIATIDQLHITTLGIPLQINGRISQFKTKKRNLDLRASISEVDLNRIQKNIPPSLLPSPVHGLTFRGKITGISAHLTGSAEQPSRTLTYSGKARLTDLQVTSKDIPSLVPRINGTIEIDSEKVKIPHVELALLDSQTTMAGSVANILKEPALDVEVTSHIPKIAPLYQALPPGLFPSLAKVKVEGGLRIKGRLFGNLKKPSALRYRGEATLQDINLRSTQYGSLSPGFLGTVYFNEHEISTEDLQISLSESDFRLKGKVAGYRKAPFIHMDMASKYVNLDNILNSLEARHQQSPPKKPAEKETGPIDLQGISASGNIHIAELHYKDITFRDVKTDYQLKDNIFQLKGFRTRTEEHNSILADGWIQVNQMNYSAQLDMQSFPVYTFFSAFWPKLAPFFSGDLSTQMNITGQGLSKKDIQKNLDLQTTFKLQDGKIKGTELGKGMALLLQAANLSDPQFDHFEGHMNVEKGNVLLDSELTSSDYIMKPQGTIGLDGSLNLSLPVKISPQISQKSTFLKQYVADSSGWTTVPIKAKGTVTKPSLKVDTETIRKETEKRIKEKVKEKLLEKLFQ